MTDPTTLLDEAKTVRLIDWPSRDVPDTLARHGFTVASEEDHPRVYEVDGDQVQARIVERLPLQADLVYAHRPVDELPEIVETAKSLGAKAVWIQSGRDQSGAKDPRGCWLAPAESAKAREIVEGAGLTYVETSYIGDAVRGISPRSRSNA